MQPHRQSAQARIRAVIDHRPVFPLPRGELWLGRELFQRAGLADTVKNHFRLAGQLGQEIVCLPVTGDLTQVPNLGYRYFEIADLVHVTDQGDQFIAAVIDGPFQSLVNQKGLMTVLKGWVGTRPELIDAYAVQQTQTIQLIERCLACGVQGIVIADDLAGERGPLISPADIQTLCEPFYREAVRTIHMVGGPAFVHCCGDIRALAPLFRTWGIDGLAAVQNRINHLVSLRRDWEGPLTIMAGIDAKLLETDAPQPSTLSPFERLVAALAPEGGLIIGSACGLYRSDFLPRLETYYALADRLTDGVFIAGR